jgi:hypothetical protein
LAAPRRPRRGDANFTITGVQAGASHPGNASCEDGVSARSINSRDVTDVPPNPRRRKGVQRFVTFTQDASEINGALHHAGRTRH